MHNEYVEWCNWCNRSRMDAAHAEWLAGLAEWDYAVTLTFDPKRKAVVPPGPQRHGEQLRDRETLAISSDVARFRVRRWIRKCEKAVGPLRAVVGFEKHRSGWPHMHGLLEVVDGRAEADLRGLAAMWYGDNGYALVEVPRNLGGAARYAAKYLQKDGDLLYHGHYRTVDNIAAMP